MSDEKRKDKPVKDEELDKVSGGGEKGTAPHRVNPPEPPGTGAPKQIITPLD